MSRAVEILTLQKLEAAGGLADGYALEELWQIKRQIASEYPTLEAYFMGFLMEGKKGDINGTCKNISGR